MTVSLKYNHAVVSVILHPDSTNRDKLFLSVARPDNQKYGLPGGKVEIGESYSVAVQRETLEETGCIIHVPQHPIFSQYCVGSVSFMTHGFYPDSITFPEGFSFDVNDPFPGPEGTNLRWMTGSQLSSSLYSPFSYYNQCLFKTLNLW